MSKIAHVTVGEVKTDWTQKEMDDVAHLFDLALRDPLGATVVTVAGVKLELIETDKK